MKAFFRGLLGNAGASAAADPCADQEATIFIVSADFQAIMTDDLLASLKDGCERAVNSVIQCIADNYAVDVEHRSTIRVVENYRLLTHVTSDLTHVTAKGSLSVFKLILTSENGTGIKSGDTLLTQILDAKEGSVTRSALLNRVKLIFKDDTVIYRRQASAALARAAGRPTESLPALDGKGLKALAKQERAHPNVVAAEIEDDDETIAERTRLAKLRAKQTADDAGHSKGEAGFNMEAVVAQLTGNSGDGDNAAASIAPAPGEPPKP